MWAVNFIDRALHFIFLILTPFVSCFSIGTPTTMAILLSVISPLLPVGLLLTLSSTMEMSPSAGKYTLLFRSTVFFNIHSCSCTIYMVCDVLLLVLVVHSMYRSPLRLYALCPRECFAHFYP